MFLEIPMLKSWNLESSLNQLQREFSILYNQLFILSLSISGNVFTIYAFKISKWTQHFSTAYVVNMSVIEMLFCIIILPGYGIHHLYFMVVGEPLLNNTNCVPLTTIGFILAEAELQSILAITVTRYINLILFVTNFVKIE